MKIDLHKKFSKRFKRFPRKVQEQFYKKLEIFENNPFDPTLNNHSVHFPYDGCRSINVTGDIRALYEVASDTITFTHIGTHSELYK